MGIFKHEIINPTTDSRKPFLDKSKTVLYIPINTKYRYYVEAATTDEVFGDRNYYLLLGIDKFDSACRLCHTDGYGRCQVKLRGEILEFVRREIKDRGNVNVDYVESIENYDVFIIT